MGVSCVTRFSQMRPALPSFARNSSRLCARLQTTSLKNHLHAGINAKPVATTSRAFSTSRARKAEDPFTSGGRDRAAVGVFTPTAAAIFVVTGVSLFWYFRYEKQKSAEQREKELADKQVGRPTVGGPFSLTAHTGETFTEQNILGKWSLIYFGFTNCPDICPEELDKMSAAVEELEKRYGPVVQPIFISVDPARDSVPQVRKYVSDFHPRLIGLTGAYDTVKATCKAYRVYFSTPRDAKATDDYLVDHSIFFYFMDPNGKFVEAFGKASTAEDVVERVQKEIDAWKGRTGSTV
ncbi:h-sco1 [Trametopsis cervina]|nr:h-sco1 [Trametopsis cervina]